MEARPSSRAARAAALLVCSIVAGAPVTSGCLTRPIAEQEPRTTSTVVERLTHGVDKIDILLAIDNSGSMKDKQEILALAVPDLVERLVNPRCIDPRKERSPETPDGPDDPCSAGMEREFNPVRDVHIAIISSSIGGHGASMCRAGLEGPQNHPSTYDMARLLARSSPDAAANDLPTYRDMGFLAWDPGQKLDPPGEAVLDDGQGNGLVPALTSMVQGVGDIGCGYESQLESIYRFLVDPAPYATITVKDGLAVPEGLDTTILEQRKAFLRPDSLLAIVMLSDENDCSMREGGRNYVIAETRTSDGNPLFLPRARSECITKGPNDPCCKSCSLPRGECPVDESCGPEDRPLRLTEEQDPHNLRCFDQKRRFGADLLYPIKRYTDAFTQETITDREGNVVQNPLFMDLDPTDENRSVRTKELVFFAGLVGVPWQDIARQTNGVPDLLNGVDMDGNPVGGFKSAGELLMPVAGLPSTWDVILGDPARDIPPADPHMIESREPRLGTAPNPITGTPIAGPDSPDDANPINGHDWEPNPRFGDLQYACTFPLPTPYEGPDCGYSNQKSPLCEDAPDGTDSKRQVKAKAYPGLRQLQLIRDLGNQGIVGSVCPAQLEDPQRLDYGYRPAMGAIVDRLKDQLQQQCLPFSLKPDANGQVSCLVLEARSVPEGRCACADQPARRDVSERHRAAARVVLEDELAKRSGWNCVCEVEQVLDPVELSACQDTPPPGPVVTEDGAVDGWCYVDPGLGVGNEELVARCPQPERRLIRFVGAAQVQEGATQFITCAGETGAP